MRYFLGCFLLVASLMLWGQTTEPNPHRYNALSARVAAINYGTLNEELGETSFTYGLELGFRRQFGKYIGVKIPLKIGVMDVGEFENPVFGEGSLIAELYPFGTLGKVSPYVHVGGGSVTEDFESLHRQFPIGGGINLLLGENSWLGVQGEYRISDKNFRDNVQFSVGYIYRLQRVDNDKDGVHNRDDQCPEVAGSALTGGCPDRDGDGVRDSDDECPEVLGVASLNGCPDSDGDGVADREDYCPQTAGTVATQGCPDYDLDGVGDAEDECPEVAGSAEHAGCPDTDGDGLYDNEDKCPEQAATTPDGCPVRDRDGDGFPDEADDCPDEPYLANRGCPLPDRDEDGTADRDDRCPDTAGPSSNQGCPIITEEVKETLEFAAQAVEFQTGSAKLKEESYVILAEIVAIMKQYPNYNLLISGHTDNTGSETNNQRLSERRAQTCMDFLVATGVARSRVSFVGYGSTRPKAPNATTAGRALNRRVEFTLGLRK